MYLDITCVLGIAFSVTLSRHTPSKFLFVLYSVQVEIKTSVTPIKVHFPVLIPPDSASSVPIKKKKVKVAW